ncbi:MAG: RDD family protein [Roseinatronobacter sp.]
MTQAQSPLPDPQLFPEFYADVAFKRSIAWVIDMVITLVLTLLGLLLTLFTGLFFLPVLYSAISIAYRTVMLSRYGATFGMMVMALTWRGLDGRQPDPTTAFGYSALHAVIWLVFLLQIASIVSILMTPYRQGLHDLFLGTTILNKAATG